MQTPPINVPFTTVLHGRVSFWYIFVAVGGDNRHLQVLSSSRLGNRPIWAATAGQAAIWKYAEVEFFSYVTMSLVFSVDQAECATPTALDTILVERGLPSDDCDNSLVSCDFENGHLCGWDLEEGPNRWKLGRGQTGDGLYAIDEAAQGEGFVYVDSSNLPFLHEPAEIDTQYQPPINSPLSFYFRAYGHGVVSLSLFLDINGTRYLLWSTLSARRDWQQASAEICSESIYKVLSYTIT